MSRLVERYQLVAAGCQVRERDSSLLLDELGHRFQLVLADVDELASVVGHSCQQAILLQLANTINGVLKQRMV